VTLEKPERRMSLVAQLIKQIRDLIDSGDWPVGMKLPGELELVRITETSRTSVREALRSLEHMGLLEARAGDGTYIVSSNEMKAALKRRRDTYTIDEAYEIRSLLEQHAARLAAHHITDSELAEVRQSLQARDQATTKEEYVIHDIAFHQAIVHASGNALLIDLYESIEELGWHIAEMVERLEHHFSPTNQDLNQKHHDLVEAIALGREDLAERLSAEIIYLAKTSHIESKPKINTQK